MQPKDTSLLNESVRDGSRMAQVAIYNIFYLLVPSIFWCFHHMCKIPAAHILSIPDGADVPKSHGIFPTITTISPKEGNILKIIYFITFFLH